MWRNSMATPKVTVFNILLLISSASGVIHTEGGSFDRKMVRPYIDSNIGGDYGEDELVHPSRNPSPTGQRQLSNIIDGLAEVRSNQPTPLEDEDQDAVPLEMLIEAAKQQQRDTILARERAERNEVNYLGQYGPAGDSADRDPNEEEIEELKKFGRKFRELQQDGGRDGIMVLPEYEPQAVEIEEEESQHSAEELKHQPAPPKQTPKKELSKATSAAPKRERIVADKLLTAQKKGQSEFVEFVEPVHMNSLKNLEFMEKRVADGGRFRVDDDDRMLGLISSSGNILFIAFITMCCALAVVGVVGGAYYYRHIRPEREDPFDDFTRYSPAGPGKQFKKGQLGNFSSEKGDETLAYRAQLHHYQQTKQKIIGGGDEGLGGFPGSGAMNGGRGGGTVDDDTDKSEDEGELEHNYSVYECPGLAPTGDIEVQNPNFVDNSGGGGGKQHRVKSPQSPEHRG